MRKQDPGSIPGPRKYIKGGILNYTFQDLSDAIYWMVLTCIKQQGNCDGCPLQIHYCGTRQELTEQNSLFFAGAISNINPTDIGQWFAFFEHLIELHKKEVAKCQL